MHAAASIAIAVQIGERAVCRGRDLYTLATDLYTCIRRSVQSRCVLKEREFNKPIVPLWIANPCSAAGSAVSQLGTLFSLIRHVIACSIAVR